MQIPYNNMIKNSLRPKPKTKPASEKGSALVFIFITIALFAALSFTVGEMLRGEGSPEQISSEKAKLVIGEVLDYGIKLRQVVQTLRISGACETDMISFTRTGADGYEHSPAAADSCKIFHSSGGGLNYTEPSASVLDAASSGAALYGDWYFPRDVCVEDVGDGGAGCDSDGLDNEDLLAVLPYVRRQICIEINNRIGIPNPGGNPPSETGDGWTAADLKFNGTFSDGAILNQGGLLAGCFEGSGTNKPPAGTYHFFQVLVSQ